MTGFINLNHISIINEKTIVTTLLLLSATFHVAAQTSSGNFEQFRREKTDEFKKWRHDKQTEFEKYRQRLNDEFADMMERSWKTMAPPLPRNAVNAPNR